MLLNNDELWTEKAPSYQTFLPTSLSHQRHQMGPESNVTILLLLSAKESKNILASSFYPLCSCIFASVLGSSLTAVRTLMNRTSVPVWILLGGSSEVLCTSMNGVSTLFRVLLYCILLGSLPRLVARGPQSSLCW